QLSIDAALATPQGMGKTPIGHVLSAVELSDDKQRVFMSRLKVMGGTTNAFWRDLAKNDQFSADEVAHARFAVDLGRDTRGHLPLIQALAAKRAAGEIRGTRDLA